MKTKIVYVLCSNENDNFLEQVILSAYSLKLHNADSTVCLVVDDKTQDAMAGDRLNVKKYIDKLVSVNLPEEFSQKERSRWLKTSLREIINGDFLYIDTDTIISDSLQDIDEFNFDIGAVLDRHVPMDVHPNAEKIKRQAKVIDFEFKEKDSCYFNAGVLYVKDNEKTHLLYKKWHSNWLESRNRKMFVDQPSLAKANRDMGYIIKEMDGLWNCQVLANGLSYLTEGKVLHYFASNMGIKTSIFAFNFADPKILNAIRNNNYELPDDLKAKVSRCRRQFAQQTEILSGAKLDLYRDDVVQFVFNQYFFNPRIYQVLKMMVSFQRSIRKLFKKTKDINK